MGGYYKANSLLGGGEAKREFLNRLPSGGHEKGWPHVKRIEYESKFHSKGGAQSSFTSVIGESLLGHSLKLWW